MALINEMAVIVLKFLGTYWLHSTVIFLMIRAVKTDNLSPLNKDHLLRFSLLGGVITSLLQVSTGWGIIWPINHGPLDTGIGSDESTGGWNIYWPIFLAAIWLGTVIILITKHIITYRMFIRAIVPTDTFPSKANEWLTQNKDLFIHHPNSQVFLTHKMISPFIHAGNRIVFPVAAFEKLNNNELRVTFAHELAHVKRRDWYWLQTFQIIQCIFFFQPLHRISKSLWIRNAENICDRRAVQFTNDGPSLAGSILEMAGWSYHQSLSQTPAMAASYSALEERVTNSLDGHPVVKDRRWISIFVIGFLSMMCVLVIPQFSLSKPGKTNKQTHLEPGRIKKNIRSQTNMDLNIELALDNDISPP